MKKTSEMQVILKLVSLDTVPYREKLSHEYDMEASEITQLSSAVSELNRAKKRFQYPTLEVFTGTSHTSLQEKQIF